MPRADKTRGIRVRIFTVQEELPFAGHPTLGTAFVVRGQTGAEEIQLELNVGTVPVKLHGRSRASRFRGDDAEGSRVWGDPPTWRMSRG